MLDFKTKTFDSPSSTTGENIGTGDGATDTYTHTASNTPIVPGTVTISVANENTEVTDDGEGNLIGDVNSSGTNTIDYDDGSIDVQFSSDIGNTNDIDVAYDHIDITIPAVTGEVADDTPDGSKQVFKGQLANGNIVPNSVTFTATIGTGTDFEDNGEGVIQDTPGNGELLVGHINYETGDFYLRFASGSEPDDTSDITVDYDHSLENGNAEVVNLIDREEYRGSRGIKLTEEDGNDVAILFEYSTDRGNSRTTKSIELIRGYGELVIAETGRFDHLRAIGANGAVNVQFLD